MSDILTDKQIAELVGRAVRLFQKYGYPEPGDKAALIKEEDGWTLRSLHPYERQEGVVAKIVIPDLSNSGTNRDLELYSFLFMKLKNRMNALKSAQGRSKEFYKKFSKQGVDSRKASKTC